MSEVKLPKAEYSATSMMSGSACIINTKTRTSVDSGLCRFPLYSADQMEEYGEQRVMEALKYVSDGARMYDLGTPDGHAIADFIDSYAEAQKLNK